MYKLRVVSLFFRESIGIFQIFLGFAVFIVITEGGWLKNLFPILFLKAVEYTGLYFYYRILRPHKLIFFMNLGQNIPRLWFSVFAFDFIISFASLILVSP